MKATDSSNDNRSVPQAFTLIELLVVIAVIAILTAIFIPVGQTVITQSHQTKCVQNLRSIGVAVRLYTNDHDGFLPGPTYFSQKAGPDSDLFLSSYLRPYLDNPKGKWTLPVSAFQCPSVDADGKSYLACHQIRSELTNAVMSPWGRASNTGDYNKKPMRLNVVDNHYSLSGQWAIRDAHGTPAVYRPYTTSPLGPVRHGKTSVLFFDGHVELE